MAEVFKVARCSKNLQGTYVKILKHAAVVGSASAEVLRTRADCTGGMDDQGASIQLKALRKELNGVKREAQKTKEEADRAKAETELLRKELTEMKAKHGIRVTRGRRRKYVRDSSSSPSPDRGQIDIATKKKEPGAIAIVQTKEVAPMEVEENTEDAPKIIEYSDERRRKELLPPGETWPEVWRPPLGGKAVILEDRMLDGHRVRMVRKEESPTATRPTTRDKEDGGAQALMKQLAPLLEEWLRTSLTSIGLQIPGKGKLPLNPPAKTKVKGGKGDNKGKSNPNPLPPSMAVGSGGTGRSLGTTTIPNKSLWSDVASGAAGARVASTPPRAA